MKLYLAFTVLLTSFVLLAAEGEEDSDDSDDEVSTTPGQTDKESEASATTSSPSGNGEGVTEQSQNQNQTDTGARKPGPGRKPGGGLGGGRRKHKGGGGGKRGRGGGKGRRKGWKKGMKLKKENMKPSNDSIILGMYRLASDPKSEDFNEFLKAMEYSAEDREKVRNSYVIHVNIEKGKEKDEYAYSVFLGFKVTSEKYKVGEEYEAELFDGRKYKAVVFISENVITREEKHENFEAHHEAKFSKEGFEIEMCANNKTAKQKYMRAGPAGYGGKVFESLRLQKGFENFFKG